MNWTEFNQAWEEAKRAQTIADGNAQSMAKMIAGRLRRARVDSDTLRELKNELRNFDARSGRWVRK